MGVLNNIDQLHGEIPALPPGINMPLLSRERFAEMVGVTAATVYSMADRGYLPTVHFGRRVFVNLEALRAQCAAKALL